MRKTDVPTGVDRAAVGGSVRWKVVVVVDGIELGGNAPLAKVSSASDLLGSA